MKRYPAYKDSGVEWFPTIPADWSSVKLKYISTKVGSGITPRGGSEIYQQSGVPLLRSQNIHFTGLRLGDVAYIPKDIHESMSGTKVKAGDVLLNITGASIGRCYYVDEHLGEANVNQHVCIIRPDEKVLCRYLNYVLASEVGQTQVFNCQIGTSREGLNFEQLKNFHICLPNELDQSAIIAYLDYKTHSIDTLIEKKQRQIELLQEQRAAIINQAVTKGLDPNVKMKDSGVEWLGEVPEHWDVLMFGKMAQLQRGHDLPDRLREEGDFPIVSSAGISGFHSEPKVKAPGVVTGRYGTIGKPCYVENDFWPLNTTLYVKDFIGNEPKFVFYVLHYLPFDIDAEKIRRSRRKSKYSPSSICG